MPSLPNPGRPFVGDYTTQTIVLTRGVVVVCAAGKAPSNWLVLFDRCYTKVMAKK